MSDLISREAAMAAVARLKVVAQRDARDLVSDDLLAGAEEGLDGALLILRALPAATAVKVKPLVWEESVKGRWIGTPPVKLGDLSFWIFLRGSEFGRSTKNGWEFCPTLDAAKAAAQADYESRILDALEGGDA